MLRYTDIRQAPWTIVPSDHKKSARLNTIADILRRIPYKEVPPEHELTKVCCATDGAAASPWLRRLCSFMRALPRPHPTRSAASALTRACVRAFARPSGHAG